MNVGAYLDESGHIVFGGSDLHYINHGNLPIGNVTFRDWKKAHLGKLSCSQVTWKWIIPGSLFRPAPDVFGRISNP